MSTNHSIIDLLMKPPAQPLVLNHMAVVYGDDPFLRREGIEYLLSLSQVERDCVRSFDGEECLWRDVHDEISTVSLFDETPRKVAVVRDASDFISKSRPQLEKWLEHPPETALLILDTDTWMATTNLYKSVTKNGLHLQCSVPKMKSWGNPPDLKMIEKWVIFWGAKRHRLKLPTLQAERILDLVGAEFGLIDNELAKLALFADAQGHVTDEQLKTVVGGWRKQTVWEIIEALAEGNTAGALEQIDRLLETGESVLGIIPLMAWSFRRMSMATHLLEQSERQGKSLPLAQALAGAGFRPAEIAKAEKQIKRLGRARARQMTQWFLEADMKLKGSHSTDHRSRLLLEELCIRIGQSQLVKPGTQSTAKTGG